MKIFFVLLFSIALCSQSAAAVKEDTGNFYVSFTDAILKKSNGASFEVGRSYNSMSSGNGQFGAGWGSQIDAIIEIGPNGAPIYYPNGLYLGGVYHFEPLQNENTYLSNLEATIETMVSLYTSDNSLDGDTQENSKKIQDFKSKIKNNRGYRTSYWRSYLKKKRVSAQSIEVGQRFIVRCTCSFAKRTLTRTPDGYLVVHGDEKEYYNLNGQLVQTENKKFGKVIFVRSKKPEDNGFIQRLEASGKSLHFFKNSEGLVDRIVFRDNEGTLRYAMYSYDEAKNLILSKDAGGNIFRYSYDEKHNITSIRYSDNTQKEMVYDQKFIGRITSLKARDGSLITYQYGRDNELSSWTSIEYFKAQEHVAASKGRPYKTEKKTWVLQQTPSGARFTKNLKFKVSDSVIDDAFISRDLQFDERGLLTQAVTGSSLVPQALSQTHFRWDDSGRVERRMNRSWSERFDYLDLNSTKVSTHTIIENGARTQLNFDYEDGKISKISGPDVSISLSYDNKFPKLLKSIQTAETLLEFERNEEGTPVTLAITHAEERDVLSIESSDGNNIYLRGSAQNKMKALGAIQGTLRLIQPIHQTLGIFQ